MSDLDLALVFIAGLTLVLGLMSGFVRRRVPVASEPMLAVALGVLVGPNGFDVLRMEDWGDPLRIMEQVARLTLAVSIMATALRLPPRFLRAHVRSIAVLLGPVMLAMWAVSGLLTYTLFDYGFWTAALIGAVLTPTDPVLAATIVEGQAAREHIPGRLRHLLSVEAGANDGAAYAFVLLPVLLLTHLPGEGVARWLTHTLPWDILGALVMGGVLGLVVGKIQNWSEDRGDIENTSMVTVTVALAFTTLAAVHLVGSDGLLAVFAAGVAFNAVARQREEAQETQVQEAIDRLFTFPFFVFFGMILPWEAWAVLGWPLGALALLVLLLRRLPAVAALSPLLSPLHKRADVLFTGWFGPIGVAAVYYALYAVHHVHQHEIWEVVSLVVLASTVAHGVTSTPGSYLYQQRALEPTDDVERPEDDDRPEDETPEGSPSEEAEKG